MNNNIGTHLIENRVYKPAKESSKKARIKTMAQYSELWWESIGVLRFAA